MSLQILHRVLPLLTAYCSLGLTSKLMFCRHPIQNELHLESGGKLFYVHYVCMKKNFFLICICVSRINLYKVEQNIVLTSIFDSDPLGSHPRMKRSLFLCETCWLLQSKNDTEMQVDFINNISTYYYHVKH